MLHRLIAPTYKAVLFSYSTFTLKSGSFLLESFLVSAILSLFQESISTMEARRAFFASTTAAGSTDGELNSDSLTDK